MLAVANDKLYSTKALLENGADQNIADTFGNAPIHEVTENFSQNKNAASILKMLLKYGADPNKTAIKKIGKDTTYFNLPLMNAIKDSLCFKILYESGGNVNYTINGEYLVRRNLFILDLAPYQNIFIIKYLVLEKAAKVPDIFTNSFNKKSITALSLLRKFNTYNDLNKENAKQEILTYLENEFKKDR